MRSLHPRRVQSLSAGLTMALAMTALAMTATGQADANAPASHAVRGVVWSPTLEPVPNATVTLRAADWSVLKAAKTDASGAFLISGLTKLPAYCCATAPGLHSGCELTPSAYSTASLFPSASFPSTSFPSASRPSAPSPAASSPASAQPPESQSPVYVDIKLYAAARIRGVVKDDAGNPVKGAQVIAAFDHASSLLQRGQLEEATTDDKGYFSLAKVPLGDITVRASADGFEYSQSEVYLRGDREVTVVMQRGKGRDLVVTVKGVPKERLADVSCSMSIHRPYPEPAMILPQRLLKGSLDANGEWVISGLPLNVELSMIKVSAPGMHFDKQWQTVAAGKNGKVTFELDSSNAPKLAPQVPGNVENPTLHGVLLDEKRRPMSDMQVLVYSTGTDARHAVTDELGRFASNAKYTPGARISFSIHNPDWVLLDDEPSYYRPSQTVRIEYVTDMVATLTATPATKFSGKVTASRGVDVAGLLVVLESAEPGSGSAGTRMTLGRATTDIDGKFLIEGLPSLKEPAWFVISGMRGVGTAGPYKTKGKQLVKNVRLKLRKPVMVTGTAVDKKGDPIPGARIRLIKPNGRSGRLSYFGLDTLTDAEGRFAFCGMQPDEYTLQVRIRGPKVVESSKSFKLGQRRSLDKKLKVTGR
ncbi:MAG: hypothetical protein ACI85K_002593 [Hyphomicrobiaceae bacterium]|jgi:hypothetical protein